MITTILSLFFLSLILLAAISTRVRYYLLSYFLNFWYDHPRLGGIFGIRYEHDTTFKTNRQKSQLYVDGFAFSLLRWIVGFDALNKVMIRDLATLMARHRSDLNLDPILRQRLFNRRFSFQELEDEMADIIWLETNRIFEIIKDKAEEEKIRQHLFQLRVLINVAQGRTLPPSLLALFMTIYHVRQLVKKLAPTHTALVLLSHIALSFVVVENLARYNGKWQGLEVHNLLKPRLRYLTVLHNGNLCIINRYPDSSNNQNNRGFGPFGMQCPGAGYAHEFLKQSLTFFSSLDVTIEGTPKLSPHYSNVQNPHDCYISFKVKAKELNLEVVSTSDVEVQPEVQVITPVEVQPEVQIITTGPELSAERESVTLAPDISAKEAELEMVPATTMAPENLSC